MFLPDLKDDMPLLSSQVDHIANNTIREAAMTVLGHKFVQPYA